MAKRIILLLDGTWNDWESGDNDTNIVRLEDLIVSHLEETDQARPVGDAAAGATVRALKSAEGKENYVFYQRGVGTGYDDRLTGGVFGSGLTANIRRAYKFLSFHYHAGDQIFVFGFSRGAYTARSLVGYIAAAGLLKRDDCTHENEEAAWNFYRTPPADRLPADWVDLEPYVHDRATFRISCIGVFDTVGALGIPLEPFTIRNRQKFAFHDVTLSSITDVNLHAIAIDEHREPFRATLWRRPRYKQYETVTEQVWFAGVHADIGGGYISAEARKKGAIPCLDEITLDWMIRRIKKHFNDFPIPDGIPFEGAQWANAPQHNSRTILYKAFPLAIRSIANFALGKLGFWKTSVSYDRRDEPIGEAVHISALERLGRLPERRLFFKYKPRNLVVLLPLIRRTYGLDVEAAGTPSSPAIRIVNWEGRPFDPEEQCDRDAAQRLLGQVAARLPR